jgi:hypothetical protein
VRARIALLLVAPLLSCDASPQTPAAPFPTPSLSLAPCDSDPAYHLLDFWLGDWVVLADGREVGTNRVEKILAGCAVKELWRGAEGGRGDSLFFVQPGTRRWKQVWVTDEATSPGGLKEKQLVVRLPGGGTRFQGEIPAPDGRVILDRTTLTPSNDGRVHQLIEISRDGGSTWVVTFDAWYVRKGKAAPIPGPS